MGDVIEGNGARGAQKSPLYLHPSDSPGMVLVSRSFDGSGFSTWKRSMRVSLSAKNKIGFVNGSVPKPKIDSEEYRDWEKCNDMVVAWILNSVSKEIADSIIFTESAQEMWSELCVRYGQTNLAQSFAIQKELCTISQGNDSITSYFTRIKGLWDELTSLRNLPACTCETRTTWRKLDEDQKLLQLLMGLNESFLAVRGSVFMMNPTPSVSQVFSMLLHEEKQREVRSTSQFSQDASAMNAKSGRQENNSRRSPLVCTYCKKNGHSVDYCWQKNGTPGGTVPTKRPPLMCTHCKKTGHTVENCYKLIGFPPRDGSDSRNKRVAAQASMEHGTSESSNGASSSFSFSADECAQLRKLLGKCMTDSGNDFAGSAMAGPFSEEPTGSW